VTGEAEQATLFTRALPDGHVLYALAIVPAANAAEMNTALVKVMRSLVVRETGVHKAPVVKSNPGLRLGASKNKKP
jgi:hypothetical protein